MSMTLLIKKDKEKCLVDRNQNMIFIQLTNNVLY